MADSPAELWSAFACLIAGQPRVRISRDSGRNYPQRYERELTAVRPQQPAAVLIYGSAGTCRTLCLDFDVSKGGLDAVLSDVKAMTQWLYEHDVKWIQDYSPNGGRHVYVPLETPMPFNESRELVQALAQRHKSIDPTPHQNIRHGCIRVPGSTHKTGGHQKLEMSPQMAASIFARPAGSVQVQKLLEDLSPEIKSLQPDTKIPLTQPTVSGAQSRMSRSMVLIASQGLFDTSRYDSPSEARQAVLVAAAAAGLALTDVQRRMQDGTWPGLAQFYARYSPAAMHGALRRDWANAHKFVSKSAGSKHVQKTNTSQLSTQGGSVNEHETDLLTEHRFIRTWRTALRHAEPRYASGKLGMARRMILRALGEAAHKKGSRTIEFGVRSISIASGLESTTVAAHLRALRSEADPLIMHTGEAIGINADQYTLVIPEHLVSGAEAVSWRRGKLHSMRPAFRELGMPAAFVFESLEHSPGSIHELVRSTGLGRSTVHEALEVLASWKLARKSADGWEIIPGTSLSALAELLGVAEQIAETIIQHRAQRAIWRDWLAKRQVSPLVLLSPDDDYPWENFEGPPDDWTLSDIAFGVAA